MLIHDYTTSLEQKMQQTSPVKRFTTDETRLNTNKIKAEQQLLKLLQQYRHTTGWIVLVDPVVKPNKAFWQAAGLPTNRILVIYQEQIKNIKIILNQAISNSSCKVVINCAPLKEHDQTSLAEFAMTQQTQFYNFHQEFYAAH